MLNFCSRSVNCLLESRVFGGFGVDRERYSALMPMVYRCGLSKTLALVARYARTRFKLNGVRLYFQVVMPIIRREFSGSKSFNRLGFFIV